MDEFRRYLAQHHGVFTRGHARTFGFSESQIHRRLQSGEWIRMAARVYRLAASPETWLARARAGALSSRGLTSHTAGLRVWSVDGHLGRTAIHVTVEASRRARPNPLATVHRLAGSRLDDGRLVNGVPVTRIELAVIDSASLLTADELDATIDAVVRQNLTSVADLVTEIDRLGTRGRKGLGVLRRLLADRDESARVPDSRFNRLVGQLLVAGGLPQPHYEYLVRRQGRFAGRADLAYPEASLLIECESARWHHNRKSFEADPRRRNRLLLAGYRVVSFTWDDYATRPDELVAVVSAAYHDGLQRLNRTAR